MLYVKFGKNRLSEEMSFENVDDDGGRMPAYTISSPMNLRLTWANKWFCRMSDNSDVGRFGPWSIWTQFGPQLWSIWTLDDLDPIWTSAMVDLDLGLFGPWPLANSDILKTRSELANVQMKIRSELAKVLIEVRSELTKVQSCGGWQHHGCDTDRFFFYFNPKVLKVRRNIFMLYCNFHLFFYYT